jgi:hypothetical protein
MAWPQSQDYNEAIQNPATSFGDAELRGGQAGTNALGLPMPRSGSFADVYEYHGASGQKWAIKCFTRQVPGLQERYAAISQCLARTHPRFAVDFTYLPKGIRVRGEFYPILKMHWVEGLLLNEFVRAHLDKPNLLDRLGRLWVSLSRRLAKAGIADADLQHGNVILVPGRRAASLTIKLIDYDGMWIPALAHQPSGEVGHPAYQHPERLRTGIYNANVDRVPLLAVACALRCLSVQGKRLWDRYDNGDNLLFREADLRQPAASPLFQELWGIGDPAAHDLTGYLATSLTGAPVQVPMLHDLVTDEGIRPLTPPHEREVTALLGPGAVVNRATVATSAMWRRRSRIRTAQPALISSVPDWSSLEDDDDDAEPPPARESAPSSYDKFWLGAAAAVGVIVVAALAFWVLRKGEWAEAPEVAANTKENKTPNVPARKPVIQPGPADVAAVTKENKTPNLPARKPVVQPEPLKILAGKVRYDPKSREVVITYDFKTPDQLKDFDPQDRHLGVKDGALTIPAKQEIRHRVKLKEGTLTGMVAMTGSKGKLVSLPEGVALAIQSKMAMVHFMQGTDIISNELSPSEKQGLVFFALGFRQTEISFQFGKHKNALPPSKHQPGFFSLHGGADGFTFSQITIKGIPDIEWAALDAGRRPIAQADTIKARPEVLTVPKASTPPLSATTTSRKEPALTFPSS